MKGNLKSAILFIGAGAFIIYWAATHSPKAGLGSKIANELSGSYTMSETSYYITLAVGAIAAVYGVLKIIKK